MCERPAALHPRQHDAPRFAAIEGAPTTNIAMNNKPNADATGCWVGWKPAKNAMQAMVSMPRPNNCCKRWDTVDGVARET